MLNGIDIHLPVSIENLGKMAECCWALDCSSQKVVKVVSAMVSLGSAVFFICKGKEGKVKLRGTVIDSSDQTLVIAIGAPQAGQIANSVVYEKTGEDSIGFVRVATSAVSSVEPAGWEGGVGGSPPKLSKGLTAWESLESKAGLDSSETERVPAEGRRKEEPTQRKLEQDLLKMSQELWNGGGSGSDDSSSESDVGAEASRPGRHLAPGASSKSREKKNKNEKPEEDLQQNFQKVLMQSMAGGASPSDLMPMMMMSMMLNQQNVSGKKKKKSRKSQKDDFHGSSSSEDSSGEDIDKNSGMKSVVTLNRLHRRIHRHPRKIIKEFERELVKDLGVVEGQAWSVKDYLRKQQWGKFKGIQRTAMQDAAVYELIRAGNMDSAAAQCIQNLKSKLQSVLSGGDWTTAWLLTGLQDPLSKREFAGSQEEMSIISSYVNNLCKLKKKMKEAGATGGEDAD